MGEARRPCEAQIVQETATRQQAHKQGDQVKLLFLDTETTGLDPAKHGITQIAGIIEIDGEVKDEFSMFCQPFPGQAVTKEALEVTGKTMDEIRAYPAPQIAYGNLTAKLDQYVDKYKKEDKFFMVGQNTKFDYDFMTAFFKSNGNPYFYGYVAYHLIDVIQATALFTVAGHFKLPNMKLATVCEHFGIPLKAHDALEDVRATRQVFYRYADLIKKAKQEVAV